MIGTVLSSLVLLFAVQALLVVKLADKLTADAAARQDSHKGVAQPAGRYAAHAA
ncbi:hypothetical protein [Methylobacterium organophilum]|mgnify:CR=1 FL=1|uniref:Uncharacterized protein n=1 Tax=Methylobacterium organophilum TaxID=410 RepID=A0ABQ4T444_METOR|nr:hypothetical protein [Methylobacterium organophilum]UMY19381.1 hypothetical protein MMB17_08820 [Methylobacterium organophilum]GJE25264.1 hypothetical protein LKMONMHP_0098 [Methylobacterium organophilum]